MISFNIVCPIFLLMALGYFMKQTNLLHSAAVKNMNAVVFKIFLPAMIFKNVYDSDLSAVFNPKLIIFSVISVLICIAVLFITVPLFEKDNRKRGVLIQAMFRANFVIFGVPVSEALCGSEVSGSAAVLIAIIIPIFNFMAVITLEVFKGSKPDFKKIAKGIATNPLIIASLLGILALFTGIKLPVSIESTVANVSKIATPLALIMLGASINFKTIGENLTRIICGVCTKLIVIPLIFMSIAIFVLDFRGADIAILLALFASPPAVSSFTMAQQMGGDDELSGQLVMFGSTFSIITMFIWIYVIMQLGLL